MYTCVGLVFASSSQCILYLFPLPHLPASAQPFFLCVSQFKYGCSTLPSWSTLSNQPCYSDSPYLPEHTRLPAVPILVSFSLDPFSLSSLKELACVWVFLCSNFFYHHSSLCTWTHTHTHTHTQAEVHKSKHLTGTFHRKNRPALTKPISPFASHANSYCETKLCFVNLKCWYYGVLHHQNHLHPPLSL